jgi:TolB-like protein/DNA-binding winged helix-turn-helix (wHTH) protein/tetratricopeptide (TPR) repeat protein
MSVQFNNHRGKRYLLGECLLDPDRRLITCNGDIVRLPKKPFQVLLYLIEHRDRVVMRQELLDQFWDGKDVYDDTLRKSVGAIRKALGNRSEGARFIETRHREGYRYVGPLEEEIIGYAPSAFEIEKTRGVHIIIEEEVSQEPALYEQTPTANLPGAANKQTRRRLLSPAAVAVMLAILLGAMALTISRNQTAHTSNQPVRFPIRSIAVLPLRNLSDDPESEYFADGLTEAFITELSKIRGLKVISRASAFMFKEKDVDPREVSRRLGVGALLEGSVRKSGDTVRVETRLVRAEDGSVIWVGNTFDRDLKDIFAVQDEIGCSVAANLRVTLCGERGSQLAKRYKNADAYDALLKARYFYNKRTSEGLRKAIEYCEQAIKLDPDYAPGYAGLAGTYLMAMWYIPLDPKVAVAKARTSALRALQIDDTYDEAHEVMAVILGYEWDWPGSRKEWERVFELNPAFSNYGYAYTLLRYSPDEAVRWIKQAAELDPLSILISTNVGQILYYARRYDEAIVQLKLVLELDPNYAMAHAHLGQVYIEKRRYDEAIEEFQKVLALSERSPETVANLGMAYAAGGRHREAQESLDELLKLSKQAYVAPYLIARIHASLGKSGRALEMLEKAYQERDSHIVDLLYDPALDPLRSVPRFAGLVQRVGFTRESADTIIPPLLSGHL